MISESIIRGHQREELESRRHGARTAYIFVPATNRAVHKGVTLILLYGTQASRRAQAAGWISYRQRW